MSNNHNAEKGETNPIVNSPEWKAGIRFLQDCMVKDEDEQFSRFYDFIAGWNACKKEQSQHSYSEREVILILNQLKHKCNEIANDGCSGDWWNCDHAFENINVEDFLPHPPKV